MRWKAYKLGDILERKREIANIQKDKNYKLVTIKLRHQGVVLREIKKGDEIKSNMYFVSEGDFVLSGIDARNGAFGIVPKELDKAVITNDFWVLEPNKEILTKDFFLFLTSTKFFDYICKQCSDGTTQRIRLQKDKFNEFEISLPSIDEQKQVVSTLIGYKDLNYNFSSECTHQLSLVKQLRQAFLREAMQGKLVAQDPQDEPAAQLLAKIKAEKERLIGEKKIKKEKELPPIGVEEVPFEVPEGWVWCRFLNVCDIESNLVNPDDYLDYPHVAPNNIEKGTGKLLEFKTVRDDELISSKHLFYPGQLLYSKVRPKLNKVVEVDFSGLCSADMYPLQSKIETRFLLFAMLNDYFLREVDKFDNRVKMPKINQNQLAQIPVPLPPLAEQHRIVAKLDELMRYCDALEASIQASRVQNEGLLQQVLREALEPGNGE